MGDMVFVELPEVGTAVSTGEECAVVESVKAASDVYAPVGGEIVEVNSELVDAPETINQDPYQRGWMFRLRPIDQSEADDLLDPAAYEQVVASES
jgi:glycine cleavage system H protein